MGTEERIELHCHTKSGGNATMYEGELIRFASMMGMPAVAVTDRSSILAFPAMERIARDGNYAARPLYGMEVFVRDPESGVVNAITVLVKNEVGKENLYRFISESDCELQVPIYDLEELLRHREGLLLGSGAECGRLRRMAKVGVSDDELKKELEKLDYVELLPLEIDRDVNLRLLRLCDEMDMMVVAVSAPNYLEEEDKNAWLVLNHSVQDPKNEYGLHMFSTQEMLDAFSFLPKEKAYEIVVENTHRIADQCETFQVCPREKIYPVVKDATERLRALCEDALPGKYGEDELQTAKERLEWELEALANTGMEFIMLQVKEFLEKTNQRACDISTRGTSAGSIVMYLLGISEIDPLKFKLEPEIIFRPTKDMEIDIDLNVRDGLSEYARKKLGEVEGVGKVLNAGAMGYINERSAQGILDDYMIYPEDSIDASERERICDKIVGNVRSWSGHPGGMVMIPEGCDYVKLIPSKKLQGGHERVYFDYHSIDHAFMKLDLLSLNSLEALHTLSMRTGVDLADVPPCCDEVMELFKPDENGEVNACAELPEFHTEFARKIVAILKPTDFDDLVKISALSHGTDTWFDNAQLLVETQDLGIKDLIGSRDDLFEILFSHGIERNTAFEIMNAVRKGMIAFGRSKVRDKWPVWKKELLDAGVPKWVPWSCEKIRYLFPRAHCISYMIMNMRLGWFLVHYPEEFHAVMKETNLY